MTSNTENTVNSAQQDAESESEFNIHLATPYRGQSRPIERAFRDLAQEFGLPRHVYLDNARSHAAKAIVSKAPRR